MYLKSLDIQGFKSFADKTHFEFDKGVTGIVGPNGCGKSNVVDAIRWVLGETSAKALRGGEMADVIFNGTDRRKPHGMAEVTMTMADCENALKLEFNEVAITRRVFRDGKSEYRINDKTCRLRDIHELFMDTGIGRSAYSIMAQGQIDQILSSKPEERRAVFEEAAGITKFKKDKKEALRKLEYTEANLLRTGDVIAEQERRMNSLKRQVSKARRYQELTSAVHILDTHLCHKQWTELKANESELTTNVKSLENEVDMMELDLPAHEAAVTEARDASQALESELSDLRQRISSHKAAAEAARSRRGFNQERRAELEKRITQHRSEIEEAKARLDQEQSNFEESITQAEERQERIATGEEAVAAQQEVVAQARAARDQLNAQLRDTRRRAETTRTQVATVQAQIESDLAQAAANDERARELEEEESQLQFELEQSQERQREATAALEEQQARLSELTEAVDTAERAFQHTRGDLDAAKKAADELHRTVAGKTSKLEVLKQVLESGEGMLKGTQAVLKGLDDPDLFRAGVDGVLASRLKVEDDYALAIESVLGDTLQAVLVRDSEFAEEILDRLVTKKLGQVALLPKDSANRAGSYQTEALPKGALAWANDVVKAEDAVTDLVSTLLEKTLIVPDRESATELRSSYGDVTFVTRAGELFFPNGLIRGGASKGGSDSVLKRQNEVNALAKEVKKLEKELAEQRSLAEELDGQSFAAREEVEQCKSRLGEVKLELSKAQSENSVAERESKNLEGKLERLQSERENLSQRVQSASESHSNREYELAEAREQVAVLEQQLAEFQNESEGLEGQLAEQSERLNELQTELAVERRAHQSEQDQQRPMQSRIEELNNLIVKREAEIVDFQNRIGNDDEDDHTLEMEMLENEDAAAELEKDLPEFDERRQQLRNAIGEKEELLSKIREQVRKRSEQRGREEVTLTKVTLKLEKLEETVMERHQLELEHFRPDAHALLTCLNEQLEKQGMAGETVALPTAGDSSAEDENSEDEEAIELPGSGPDWNLIERLVLDLRRKVDSMGPVNVDAIEEFEELEERHNFVLSQHEDLVNSKTELLEVIAKINDETTKRFAQTFATVRKNFRDMFKLLFGEKGKADLVLLDEEDPLESGIEVIAKPPGKKLQSISLLSGGERSMTAVALLFSIYKVKPSPFCVLDELDAPLDESNIGRFLKVLDAFIDQSQFIIVTHSKRTMNRADIMYGVTMEEFGVSKPVGMRLTTEENKSEARTAGQRAAERLDA
ncbi:chromosome segregation protein SMC [Roseibacillus ishigakijimensis]|uniref:Chromosome partition protein Smc n=1 Tax=Roseibacillus ishigakijimensis TaxID=454146 RepID=A0A934RMZ7_9BACT|nr:chromosome segregation protein SMC [Roseibacillus ishigakijimensis]MBK1832647.1 chromosome segregation protein SMC [Roseibacillus ishigakijimensis]